MNKKKAKPKALFLIQTDPEQSARPAEAVRIAAGIAAWQEVSVDIACAGPGRKMLSPWPEILVDGNIFQQYLPVLAEHGATFHAEKDGGHEAVVKLKFFEQAKISALLSQYQFLFHY